MSFTFIEDSMETEKTARIKVIGVGGAGGNAINNMISTNLQGVDFFVANTDAQALAMNSAKGKIQIGEVLTEGLGAGANPDIGREAALENRDVIKNALEGAHMVFITAGFGGGTGTGAAPVIAEICNELEALTVAVVTKPFSFEGRKRLFMAEAGIDNLKQWADTVITIPNDRLRGLAKKSAKLTDMFRKADEILLHSVKGITDLIMVPGLVNLDFADVKTIMSMSGMAIMGIGASTGEGRATEAASNAISHPLLEDISISGAKGVLMNITSNSDLTMEEVAEASDKIYEEVGDDAEIIWGAVLDDEIGDEMRVTVIATGIGEEAAAMPRLRAVPGNIRTHGKPQKTEMSIRHHETDETFGGKLRVASPEDLKKIPDPDNPGFSDSFKSGFLSARESRGLKETRFKGFRKPPLQEQDLEVPTFLRKKAD